MATANAMFTITDTGDLNGRNLIQRSFFTKDPWTGPTYNAVGEWFGIYHDKYCLPVETNLIYLNTNKGENNLFPDLVFEEGVQYTLSGKWAQFRTDNTYNTLYLIIHHTDGTKVTAIQPRQNNVWSSFKITSTAGKTADKIIVSYNSVGRTYIADFKLEVGAAATDWTPAPEDINTAMDDAKAAQSTADNAKTEIDGLEIGGRNILKHSELAGIIQRYSNSVINTESDVIVDEWATKSGVRYYGNAGTSPIFGIIGGNVNYIAQKTNEYLSRPYAFSVYVKNLSESSRLRFLFNGKPIAEAVEIAPLEQKRVTHVHSNPNTAHAVQLSLYVDTAGDAFDFVMWHPQIEYGNRVTEWTPAPEDTDAAIADVDEKADAADTKASTALETATGAVTALNNYIAGKEIVVGTQTAATNVWTGRAGFSELVNGQEIAYWLPYAGLSSKAVTLTLTLADNSVTEDIPVYYKGTTRATTHFTAGTVVHLTYRENADVAGTTVENGWWADASYDSGNTNYYDRIRLNNSIKAKSAISASYFIVSDDSGYFHLAGGSVFDITKPILWCSTAISAGGTGSNNYISLPSLTLRNNASGITLTANKTCYLVGTLTGKTFTVKSSGFFTSTVPTSDDGYYYISLGYLYSTYQIYLYPEHPIYKFVDGSFKSLNQVAYEASVVADEAKSTAESKNSVYYQSTTPTAHKVGDTWFDTANDYKIRRWDGSTWAAAELGNQAVGNLDASHINTGTLTAVHIKAGKAQDVAGTIKVYDENDAVKVSLDKDGLMATKGKIGGWSIDEHSIQHQQDFSSSDDTVIAGDEDEQLIESGSPTPVGGEIITLKICTYDPDNPGLGPHIISSVAGRGINPQVDDGKTMRISNGGLACYYNRNNGVTGGSVSISPKVVNVINADYDEDQVLWTDSANLNPGSLTIIMSKTENGEQTAMSRSFLTHRDLAFIGDTSNPQLATGIAHWSVLSPERAVKDTLKVTIYHCGNLFWAHFGGTIPAGWTAGNTQNVLIPIITGDTDLSNSALVAPPANVTKYIIPSDLTNMRISVTVRPDGQIGISRVAEPFKGNATTTIAGYMETCDIFWAHIG